MRRWSIRTALARGGILAALMLPACESYDTAYYSRPVYAAHPSYYYGPYYYPGPRYYAAPRSYFSLGFSSGHRRHRHGHPRYRHHW